MTEHTNTCEWFQDRLADYLEGDVSAEERASLDAHVDSCEACGALVRDLRAITVAAAALPPIQPPARVWSAIAARIATDVVPLQSRRRQWVPMVRGLAAAIVLVAMSSGITYMMTRDANGDRTAAATRSTPANPNQGATVASTTVPETTVVDLGQGTDKQLVSSNNTDVFPQVTPAPEDKVPLRAGPSEMYGDEISKLRTVLRSRNSDLDPKTRRTIERSLAVIDTAIAQARSALSKDPGSQFLEKELTDALDKKVRLLRTAAMLPSKS